MIFITRSIFAFLLLSSFSFFGQQISIDANIEPPIIEKEHLNMGNSGPEGKEITINNKFLSLGGTPMVPVMGEIHYSRFNKEKWENAILKMKANGINIIATYVFWIHHEETEGEFDWKGNNDLRLFIELCKKHRVWAYPRIGPWCHGEARNGGFPDWIMKHNDVSLRTNDPKYLFYVDRLYHEISKQLEGLYYKDGGPIIGVQLENEYWRGKKGEEHILKLKQIALKYGIDVPMYTVTGWRSASVPENEVIPLWGGYPTAPWNTNLNTIKTNESYVFNLPINDQSIGNEESTGKYRPNYSLYPYLTCELGVGNQISEHRRPIIDPMDGVTIATSSVASGSNLPGYYVFAGGLNPIGKYSTLEEDKLESGYWNEYPDISYDFQAAIRETGEIAPSYHKLKPLHYFLNEFGELLAPMTPIIPMDNNAPDNLQYSFRVNKSSGFLFASNYYRGHTKSIKKNVQFTIKLNKDLVVLPSKPINIYDKTIFIWPVNLDIGKTVLKYATAQPICTIDNKKTTDWYFFETKGIDTEYLFDNKNIKELKVNGAKQPESRKQFLINNIQLGIDNPILVEAVDGHLHRIFTLTKEQSEQFWYFKNDNNEFAFLSSANLVMDEKLQLQAFSTNQEDNIIALNSDLQHKGETLKNTGFKKYIINNTVDKIESKLETYDILQKAKILNLASENDIAKNKLYNKQFFKDFNIENTADIRKATFYLYTETDCKIRINNKWLNQNILPEEKNSLDFTGYLKKNQNSVLLNFPYIENDKGFVGVLEIEFYNSDKIYITTDNTWLTAEQYKIPASWDVVQNKKEPVLLNKKIENLTFSNYRYKLSLDENKLKKYKNVYLRIDYDGDKIQCRSGNKLIADNFNNQTTWSINLNNIKTNSKFPLLFELKPFEEDPLIFFDEQPSFSEVKIKSIEIVPEFWTSFKVNKNNI
ncbi:beta-galactosidase [Mariniflexile litorale]|uniref:Beta-galactosidase n=1 Tax=Mariniflexile litorale TaxID=3045158 RepID=A0AAU7EKU1_9FLAO|nr:beta-galactosidase [Mariniflexile sp. KMM 9835]MDQ8210647.1 beta-galactosidase [Mariniflexile sp. KMM 9835]